MIIGGLQKSTLIDYPGKVAATIFVSGCNFRCPYCQNPELVLPEEIKKHPQIPLEDIWKFLKERKGFLEAVVICGGEPTIYDDLPNFAKKIKEMDYLVKLDTNGYNPEMLEKMISNKLLDYVAMDIKGPKERYSEVVRVRVDIEKIEKSIEILKEGRIDYEFRTTLVPDLVEKEDVIKIAKWISPAPKYFLQNFQAKGETVDSKFAKMKPYPDEYLKEIQQEIKPYFDVCQIR